MDLQNKIKHLFSTQRKVWQLLDDNHSQLRNVNTKLIEWDNETKIILQQNPWSHHAHTTDINTNDIDTNSIKMQKCVFCEENRTPIQKSIPFLDRYIILCNPYPVLQNHLTIQLYSHVPQLIGKKIIDMLSLVELLPNYIVLYNGAKCGAFTPWHFHFEAGLKTDILLSSENALRSCFRIEAKTKEEAEQEFYYVFDYLKSHQPEKKEPLMNIISFTENEQFIIHIFPRKTYRPWQYSANDESSILVSPNAIDMAGMVIIPQQKDFDKITNNDIEDIFTQVSMPII